MKPNDKTSDELLRLARRLVDAELPMSRDDGREAKKFASLVLEHLDDLEEQPRTFERWRGASEPRSETVETLRLFVEEGVRPGGFLTAVLANDLVDAFRRGSEDSLAELRAVVTWVYSFAPHGSWGTPEKVARWCGAKGTKGSVRSVPARKAKASP